MFNGEILSYAISYSPDLRMVMDMLEQLYEKVEIPEGMLMHSDQGWHYQHSAYQRNLKNHHIVQSMSRKGNCLDNSMMENFFGIMKSELLYLNDYNSMEEFVDDLNAYVDYYNNERIKLRLNGMSPVQYREAFMASIIV